MKARRLEKLLRMDRVELTRRGTTAARAVLDRARVAAIGSRWSRSSLAGSLVATTELTSAREALNTHRWDIAHRELARHFAHAPRRFAIDARSNRLSWPGFWTDSPAQPERRPRVPIGLSPGNTTCLDIDDCVSIRRAQEDGRTGRGIRFPAAGHRRCSGPRCPFSTHRAAITK